MEKYVGSSYSSRFGHYTQGKSNIFLRIALLIKIGPFYFPFKTRKNL